MTNPFRREWRLLFVPLVALALLFDAGAPRLSGKNRPAVRTMADVLKRPGKVAPEGGTGVPFDPSKLLEQEEGEEEGRELRADPDLEPGVAPTPMADVVPAQTAETVDIPPPAPMASSTFTIGRTSTLSPTLSSSVAEPSIGSQGTGIFVTNNWGALKSTNNGSSWTNVDPFTTFPKSPTGFTAGVCCDQRVIQDPSRDLIIWLLQYTKESSTGQNGLRVAVASGQSGLSSNTWTYHDITPSDFGLSTEWLDFPTMQISSNYLYITSNAFTGSTFYGAVIARIPLANLANNTSYTMNTFVTTSYGSITGVNGATSTMYFGARYGTTSIKVLTWPEANTSPTESTISGLTTIYTSSFSCTTPDVLNPCDRADTRMQTGWVTSTELGFMWHSSQGGSKTYPWTRVLILNPSTLSVTSQPDIYSSDSAWLYPAVAVNSRSHLGGVIDKLGGSAVYPEVRAIIRDDFSSDVTTSGWETYNLSTSTHGTSGRWGDYNGVTAHEKYPNTWLGMGHYQSGGSGDSNTGNTSQAKLANYSFYRLRDDPSLPQLSINDVTVTEGDAGTTNATFTVTMSATSSSTVTVVASTAGNTATSGTDFTATTTTVSFSPGSTSQTFTVPIKGDTLDETNETFYVNLTSESNATVLDSQGIGTITDNDAAPTISISDVTVTEGNSGTTSATFTATLSTASGQTVTVSAATANNTATSGSDYTAMSATTLTFSAGTTTQTFTVSVTGDTLDEANETFYVNLTSGSNVTISDSQGIGTITDDDAAPTISINDVTVTEGNSGSTSASFTVSLSAASGQSITVSAATANNTATSGSDYTAVSATTLTFSAGTTTQTFTVPVLGDTLDEANETFYVNLSSATNSSISDAQGQGTITDDDASPTLSVNDVTVTEGNSGSVTATFTVSLSTASGQTVTVSAATANNTATAGSDYTAVSATTLSFSAGTTTTTVAVTVAGDTLDEANETFYLNLSSPTNATLSDAQGLGTITDDDASPTLSINDVTVTEGNSGTVSASFTATLSAVSGQTVTVSAATANNTAVSGSDYTAVSATTLTFSAGTTTQTFTVPVLGDTVDEANETFYVNLSSASNATVSDSQGLGTITDDDAAPTMSISDVTVTEGNSGSTTASFTATLSAVSGQTVTVSAATANNTATSGSDYTAVSATTLTFSAGTTTQTFSVSVLGDTLDEANETFYVNLSSPTNATLSDAQGLGTITDDDASPTMSINDVTVTEGNSGTTNATFTVTLAATSGQTVTVSAQTASGTATSGTDFTATGPTTLTFSAGTTTQTFTVPVLGDTLSEANETLLVNLTSATNATISDAQGVGTITDDDGAPSLSINDVTVTEGNSGTTSATFTVTLSPASGQAVTVAAQTANSTATSGSDYTATGPTTLTFSAGTTTQTFTVPVVGDTTDEVDETFVVNLTSATAATISDAQGVGTITDDDVAPTLTIDDVSQAEGNSGSTNATFTATLSAASGKTITVTAQTADNTATAGADYTATGPTTLTFSPGSTTATFAVPVSGDTINETNETFLVNLSGASNATVTDAQGVGTITDDDGAVTISIDDATVTEGDSGSSSATFTVTLSAISGQTVTVSAQTANATAAAGSDYTTTGPTTLTFSPGVLTQTFTVPVLGDTLDEPSETFVVNLTSASNATISDSQGIGTITDDDAAPALSINDVSVAEGNSGSTSLVFTISLSQASGQAVTVVAQTADSTAAAGVDYTALAATTFTIAAGSTAQTVSVPVLGDVTDEANETFQVNLTSATNATVSDAQGIGTIMDDDAAPTMSITDVTVTEGNSGTVSAVFTASLSAASGQTVTASAQTTGVTATSGADFTATGPTTLSFSPGVTSRTFTVPVLGDTVDESNETFQVNLSSAVNATILDGQGIGTITDDDDLLTLSINDISVTEGNTGTTTATLTVTLSAASTGTVTASWATQNGTATSGSDYTAASGTLTFSAGQTSKSITVSVAGDTTLEGNEAFGVVLSGATSPVTIARAIGEVAILNDETSTATARAQASWQDFFAVDTLETPFVGDFNGDLKTDIVTFTRQNPSAVGDVYVALSDGVKFGTNTKWHDFFAISTNEAVVIGDYNGDGKDDIATWLTTTTRQVYVALSQGTGMATAAVWVSSIGVDSTDLLFSGDANGDGKDDLIAFARKQGKVYVALSDGTKFGTPTVWHSFFAVSTYERPRVGDVNGDGKADIVTFATDSPTAYGDVYVALSDGAQFVSLDGIANSSSKWHDFFAIRSTEEVRVGDLNGDGKDDFFTFLPAPFAQSYTVLSQGTSMAANVLWPQAVAPLLGSGDTVYVGDVNGDGHDDIIIFAQKEGKVYVSLAP